MATVSHIVQSIVNARPLLYLALEQGIVSYGNLARRLLPEIRTELKKEITHQAVVMALRRYSSQLTAHIQPLNFNFKSEMIVKTQLCDIVVQRSTTLDKKFTEIYRIANYQAGDTLNIIRGNTEISIVTNNTHIERIKKTLEEEKIISIEQPLAAITLKFKDDFVHTPGVIATITRKLLWDSINIFELISTNSELTIIISQRDVTSAYKSLSPIVE